MYDQAGKALLKAAREELAHNSSNFVHKSERHLYPRRYLCIRHFSCGRRREGDSTEVVNVQFTEWRFYSQIVLLSITRHMKNYCHIFEN